MVPASDEKAYYFSFYVSTMTSAAERSIDLLYEICDQYLKGEYKVEVINLSKSPEQGIKDQILATPTLIKKKPGPVKRVVGNLVNKEKILEALELDIKDKNIHKKVK